jgi:RNA-directed DNA polymerase
MTDKKSIDRISSSAARRVCKLCSIRRHISVAALDFYGGDCIWRWLMKKHKKLHCKRTRLVRLPSLVRPTRKIWREGNVDQFLLSMLRVERFRRGWMRTPAYIGVPGEPDA